MQVIWGIIESGTWLPRPQSAPVTNTTTSNHFHFFSFPPSLVFTFFLLISTFTFGFSLSLVHFVIIVWDLAAKAPVSTSHQHHDLQSLSLFSFLFHFHFLVFTFKFTFYFPLGHHSLGPSCQGSSQNQSLTPRPPITFTFFLTFTYFIGPRFPWGPIYGSEPMSVRPSLGSSSGQRHVRKALWACISILAPCHQVGCKCSSELACTSSNAMRSQYCICGSDDQDQDRYIWMTCRYFLSLKSHTLDVNGRVAKSGKYGRFAFFQAVMIFGPNTPKTKERAHKKRKFWKFLFPAFSCLAQTE